MRIYIQDDKKSVKSADNSDFMLTFKTSFLDTHVRKSKKYFAFCSLNRIFAMSFSDLSCFALQHKVCAISDMAT